MDVTGCMEARRSLLHIDDACAVMADLMALDNAPPLINIPGEKTTMARIAARIMRKYHARPNRIALSPGDQFYSMADQQVSGKLFQATLHFDRKHSFGKWIDN